VATTWLITREIEDAGACAPNEIFVPCLETRLLSWPWSPGSSALTIFTSRRAVAAWSAAGRPELGVVSALVPVTSKALERDRVTPHITSEGGVVGLARAIEQWWREEGKPSLHIRYPTSDAGLSSDEQKEALGILTALGSVDRRVVYVVTAPPQLRQSLERAAKGDWSISFASPSAIQHFFAARPLIETAPSLVACRGASTERAWNELRPESWPIAVNESEIFPAAPGLKP
jgi:uroporphyrinogen-III synthase